jgi:hypothetical protein
MSSGMIIIPLSSVPPVLPAIACVEVADDVVLPRLSFRRGVFVWCSSLSFSLWAVDTTALALGSGMAKY